MSVWKLPVNRAGNPLGTERGNTVRILLLAVLLLIALFGYLYFFTDLIRSDKETQTKSEPQTAQVKKPMPPRPGQATAIKPAETKTSESAPAAGPEKVTAATKVTQAPAPIAPGAPPEAKPPVSSPPKAEPVMPAKVSVASKAAPPPANKPTTVAAPTKASDHAVAADKKTPPRKEKKPAEKSREGIYTILVGYYPPGKSADFVSVKLGKAGITPVKKEVVSEEEPMNRLFVGEFSDQAKAVS